MNYLDKVRCLIKCKQNRLPDDLYFYDINPKEVTWKPNELENICSSYTWLPVGYVNFLKEFDGISIAFCRFYGSENGTAIVLQEEIVQHRDLLKDNYFPFASDADGSIFLFDKHGKVLWWDIEDYDFEKEPEALANTFEEFVGECLLGKRHGEFISIEKSNFAKFLKAQGWV